ncbi:MAG: hypothetical protein EBY61_10655, partial [Actinobacteria bacterium]|nr:hypothetical protein [Actinomycetota bacterium]
MKGDGVARPREVGRDGAIGRRGLTLRRERCGLVLGAEEVLEAATGDEGRVGDRHDEVERQGVVVPLVDRGIDAARLEVDVAEMQRHGVRGD